MFYEAEVNRNIQPFEFPKYEGKKIIEKYSHQHADNTHSRFRRFTLNLRAIFKSTNDKMITIK